MYSNPLRNLGMGLSGVGSRIGGIIAPLVLLLVSIPWIGDPRDGGPVGLALPSFPGCEGGGVVAPFLLSLGEMVS